MATQAPTPIAIREAFELLKIGVTKGYELVGNGELRTYCIGDRRFTTTEALAELVAKCEAEATAARATETARDARRRFRRTSRHPGPNPEDKDEPRAAKGAPSIESPASKQGIPRSGTSKRNG